MKKLCLAVLFLSGLFSVYAQDEMVNETVADETTEDAPAQPQGLPQVLQTVLNALPAIPIAGNNLKFEFIDDKWTARVNGESFSAGSIVFENTDDGGRLTLKQTHIWPGAVGKTAGRVASFIPGGAAVGNVLNTAGSIAGAVGAVEAEGPDIILEYKAGPPASLKLVSIKSTSEKEYDPASLHTLGISVGSSFIDPVLIATVHGTYSPVRYLLLQWGIDVGFISIYDDVQSYLSVYPYTRVGLFLPFENKGGWYICAGYGYMTGFYTFYGEETHAGVSAFDAATGFNIANVVDISYSIRTDFGSLSHKLSAGYVYRFK